MNSESNVIPLLMALLTVLVTAVAQLSLKHGVNVAQGRSALLDQLSDGSWHVLWNLATNPFLIAGFSLYAVSAILWIFVLSRLPLSQAYPFVGLSIVFTSIAGVVFLGEKIHVMQGVGILAVVVGVYLVASA